MKLVSGLLLILAAYTAHAQTTVYQALKPQLLKDWERAKDYTMEYLNAMPADKYAFRPNDSIRSFAEQMLHLAIADAGMCFFATDVADSNVARVLLSRNLEKAATAQSKDSVVYFVTTSYDYVINTLKNLKDLKSEEIVTRQMPAAVRSATRLGWLMKAFEHQTHHRGQCAIYVRMQGVKPPAEKLF